MKPSVAVMIGSGGKAGADHEHMEPDADDASSSTEESVQEELGTAVAEALSAKDPKALYRAICDIVKYEKA